MLSYSTTASDEPMPRTLGAEGATSSDKHKREVRRMFTLVPHIEEYLRSRRSIGRLSLDAARGQRYVLNRLAEVHHFRPLDKFGPAVIERWLGVIRDYRPSTRRHHLSVVRTFCRWMIEQGRLTKDPTRNVGRIAQPRAVERTMSPEDFVKVLGAAPDRRGRTILWVMYGCGARCIEVARLRVEDYDHRERTVLLTGKGGHERNVPVPEPVAEALDAYLLDTGCVAGPLFRSYTRPAEGITPRTMSDMVSTWMREAGVKRAPRDGISAHALRHSFAHDVLDVTDDVRVVQELLGHANVATTSRYVGRARREKMRQAVEDRFKVA